MWAFACKVVSNRWWRNLPQVTVLTAGWDAGIIVATSEELRCGCFRLQSWECSAFVCMSAVSDSLVPVVVRLVSLTCSVPTKWSSAFPHSKVVHTMSEVAYAISKGGCRQHTLHWGCISVAGLSQGSVGASWKLLVSAVSGIWTQTTV